MAGALALLALEMSLKDMIMKASMWLLTHHAHMRVYPALPEIPPQKAVLCACSYSYAVFLRSGKICCSLVCNYKKCG